MKSILSQFMKPNRLNSVQTYGSNSNVLTPHSYGKSNVNFIRPLNELKLKEDQLVTLISSNTYTSKLALFLKYQFVKDNPTLFSNRDKMSMVLKDLFEHPNTVRYIWGTKACFNKEEILALKEIIKKSCINERGENEFLELANLKGDDVTINNNGLVAWQLTNLEEANTIFQIKDWLCENFNIKVVRWDATKRDLVIQNGFEEIPSYISTRAHQIFCVCRNIRKGTSPWNSIHLVM